MSKQVARVTDIIAESPESFDDAIKVGFDRAVKTLRGITGLRIVEMPVRDFADFNNEITQIEIQFISV